MPRYPRDASPPRTHVKANLLYMIDLEESEDERFLAFQALAVASQLKVEIIYPLYPLNCYCSNRIGGRVLDPTLTPK